MYFFPTNKTFQCSLGLAWRTINTLHLGPYKKKILKIPDMVKIHYIKNNHYTWNLWACNLLLFLRFNGINLDESKDSWHMQRREFALAELDLVLLFEPSDNEWQATPRSGAKHLADYVELGGKAVARLLGKGMLKTQRFLGILPGPFEAQGWYFVGKAVYDENHVPGTSAACFLGTAFHTAAVML